MGKTITELVFVNTENGNEKTIKKSVRTKKYYNFSSYYYENQNRKLDTSTNIVVDRFLTNSIFKNNKKFDLKFVVIDNSTYKIKNIMPFNQKKRKVILDCEKYE